MLTQPSQSRASIQSSICPDPLQGTDGWANKYRVGEASVSVKILDMNDNSPVFLNNRLQNVTFSEDSPLGTVVALTPAADRDEVRCSLARTVICACLSQSYIIIFGIILSGKIYDTEASWALRSPVLNPLCATMYFSRGCKNDHTCRCNLVIIGGSSPYDLFIAFYVSLLCCNLAVPQIILNLRPHYSTYMLLFYSKV